MIVEARLADFIVSEGVTANKASMVPAPRPAEEVRNGIRQKRESFKKKQPT